MAFALSAAGWWPQALHAWCSVEENAPTAVVEYDGDFRIDIQASPNAEILLIGIAREAVGGGITYLRYFFEELATDSDGNTAFALTYDPFWSSRWVVVDLESRGRTLIHQEELLTPGDWVLPWVRGLDEPAAFGSFPTRGVDLALITDQYGPLVTLGRRLSDGATYDLDPEFDRLRVPVTELDPDTDPNRLPSGELFVADHRYLTLYRVCLDR